jgi:hypothetical protein
VIDPSIPRYRFWSDDVGGKEACPKCGHALVNEQQTYVMVVRQGGRIEPFVVGGKAGFFCPQCPAVVLDREKFEELARIGMKNDRPGHFTILGLLDMAAIPPEKRNQPLGSAGNPMPLVKFIDDAKKGGEPASKGKTASRKSGKKNKRK